MDVAWGARYGQAVDALHEAIDTAKRKPRDVFG